MNMRVILILIGTAVVIGLAAPIPAAEQNASAYAGQETRLIKAVSENDIASLRNGDGMGWRRRRNSTAIPVRAMFLRSRGSFA